MKPQRFVTMVVSIAWMVMAGVASIGAQTVPPEIAMVEQVRVWRETTPGWREDLAALFQQATFLDDPHAAQTLVDYVVQHNSPDILEDASLVLLHMTCHPESVMLEYLESETDPWQKEKLIGLLFDYPTQEVVRGLYEQLHDTQLIVVPKDVYSGEPGDMQFRVCDIAYNVITHHLSYVASFPSDNFEFPSYASFEVRDGMIETFKEYWAEHESVLREELSKLPPDKTLVDTLDFLRSKPTPPPEVALLQQVKALLDAGGTRETFEALLVESADVLDAPETVEGLISYLWYTGTLDDVLPIRMILASMTCETEPIVVKMVMIEGRSDPWQKEKLLHLLADFYSKDVLQVLCSSWDDCRAISIPEGKTSVTSGHAERVCDVVYDLVWQKFAALDIPGYEALELPPDASVEHRDEYLTALKEFWSEHYPVVFEQLPTYQPPSIVDAWFEEH